MADRSTLLEQINENGFVINDLTLYLDTHPLDLQALEVFNQAMAQRKKLLEVYAGEFEPLTQNCICPGTNNKTNSHTKYPGQMHFTWADGPLPWDNQEENSVLKNAKGGAA